jgi:hypothetical protein
MLGDVIKLIVPSVSMVNLQVVLSVIILSDTVKLIELSVIMLIDTIKLIVPSVIMPNLQIVHSVITLIDTIKLIVLYHFDESKFC